LTDTRGIEQDEHHEKNIATEIQKHIDSVNAVFILANGTVPHITVSTGYALSTLSAIFPKLLADNRAFVFTNVSGPLSWNFSQKTFPPGFSHARQLLLDTPIALQRKYLKLKDDPNMKKRRTEFREAVKVDEQDALETLMEVFGWLDGRELQRTKEIVDNPVAFQRKYLKGDAKGNKVVANLRTRVQEDEEKALEMLVDLFDRLDGLEPQPTKDIVDLYYLSQTIEATITNTFAQMDQAAAKKVEVDKLMGALKDSSYVSPSPCSYLGLNLIHIGYRI